MTQQNPGKKIADLRKAQGLTQEELVEKCNISVRTLQRIESGEGSPRSYTLRIIFDALGYNQVNEISSNKITSIISFRLGQFYKYFIDLFNLKTNTMKKVTILSVMLPALLFGLFILTTESKAQKENKSDNNSDQTTKEMVFSNSSCENCFNEDDIMIGRGVKFTNNGVTVSFRLIKLNKNTREFNAGHIKGKILLNKVESICAQDMLNDGYLTYSADKIEKSENKISLKGNAKLTSKEGDFIEADEIIISTI